MNNIMQHIPSFVDVDPAASIEFETTKDLLKLPMVKQYEKEGSLFAINTNHLMVINDNGFSWWVIGRIKDISNVDLPQWSGWKFKAESKDGTKTILSHEVVSVCGDILTLVDGSEAKKLNPEEFIND